MKQAPQAFISYRVDDSLAVATTLARELERVLSRGTVFLDHRSIEPGEPWPERLRAAVESSDVILLLIGKQWLTLQGAHGIRRLDHPDDWVRREIERAIATGRTIIPILIDGAPALSKDAFLSIPQISVVADLQAFFLSTRDWDNTFDALTDVLVEKGFRREVHETSKPGAISPHLFRSTIPSRGHAPFVGRDDLIDQVRAGLGAPTTKQFLVLHGPPGVGKSEIAREFARRHLQQYPGGVFYVSLRENGPPVDLAGIGRTVLGLSFPSDLGLRDQCIRTLLSLGESPFLLLYDNATSSEDVESWLPPVGVGGHVVVTSNWENWDPRWQRIAVAPLTDIEAGRLVTEIVGGSLSDSDKRSAVRFSGGLPVQLVPAAQVLRRAAERPWRRSNVSDLTNEARASFGAPWTSLTDDARLLLAAALCFHPDRVSPELIGEAFVAGDRSRERLEAALDLCSDLSLLTGTQQLRLHPLLAQYVEERLFEVPGAALAQVRNALRQRFSRAAADVSDRPNDAAAVATLTTFSTDLRRWRDDAAVLDARDDFFESVGLALYETGFFSEARGWFERAISDVEQRTEPANHLKMGDLLHGVGLCLSSTGQFVEARSWYERAVNEKGLGNIEGQVDHASVGQSLHCVGQCLSESGQFPEARGWYERAATEKERGDVEGRLDHSTLGSSLHQIGWCLSESGEYAEARRWYERAVGEKRQGDRRGRVDHASLGASLHQVGWCVSSTGKLADARVWYEQAVEERERGDVHGRVNHESLSVSLHQVGLCLAEARQFEEALIWFRRAIEQSEQGDLHGRVDHESLGLTLDVVGSYVSRAGNYSDARDWHERAVREKEQGDVHGRVNHASLGESLHSVGECFSQEGQFVEARGWYERAVEQKRKGDLYGRVTEESVQSSLEWFRHCQRETDASGNPHG